MELTPEQAALTQAQMPTVGLLSAYYRRYGDEAFEVSRAFALRAGAYLGENIKEALQVTGTDTSAVAEVLSAFVTEATGSPARAADLITVAGNEVSYMNDGFCDIMEAANALGAPLDKICRNYSGPVFEGVALSVNPGAEHEVRESRALGDSCCRHVIVVPGD